MSLGALFRVLPSFGTPHAREKRLHRFLVNRRLDPRGVTDGLARLIFGKRGRGLWPIAFDQTAAGMAQALVAGIPFEGRVLPLAVYSFEYPWKDKAKSQNELEEIFLLDLEDALPRGVKGIFIGDRGYARAALLRHSVQLGRLFLVRGRGGTQVEYQGRVCRLSDLPTKPGRAVRYSSVQYQAHQKVPVDVVVFHDPSFQEPWFLLVPPKSETILPTRTILALYRERMQIEQAFRDFKTHLGLRGLKLKVQVTERMGRLLLAFTIAYCLALVLGVSSEAREARTDLEIPRRKPRHGTTRTLSALSIALQMLSHPRWSQKAHSRLLSIAALVAGGECAFKRPPPQAHHRTAA